MNIRQVFLLFVALGLLPIALSYGLMPQQSLGFLFGIVVADLNSTHIYRAVMGLYLALIIFWVLGALRVQFRQAAIYSLIVFMLGLAAGRILSVFLDGVPHWLLVVYLVLELFFGCLGVLVARRPE